MKINRFLMVAILVAFITIGAVSATENMTQDDVVAAQSDSSILIDEFDDETIFDSDENYAQSIEDANGTLNDDKLALSEDEPITSSKLQLYFDLDTIHLPEDDVAHIVLPENATGRLTISFNNVKNEIVNYSKGAGTYYINAWDLNHLGENVIKVKYVGDDYGTLTATGKILVLPTITSPEYVGAGEEFRISICTHEWARGSFNVYDYNSGKKGKLLGYDYIFNRFADVDLSSSTVGLNRYYLEFDYPGGNYPIIQSVYVVENSKNITVEVTENVDPGSAIIVDVKAPASPNKNVYVAVDRLNYGHYSMEDGNAVAVISGLSNGYYDISVKYNDGYYENGKLLGNVYSKTFRVAVGVKTKITAPKITTTYNVAKNLVITLRDADGYAVPYKNVTVVLNGKAYERVCDANGQAKMSVKLPAGTHIVEFKFGGDDTYIASSGSSKVVVSKATPKLTANAKTLKLKAKTKKVTATLKTNANKVMKNTKVTLKVNKKTYTAKTNSKGIATFTIKLTKKGKYSAVYKYAGSSNYKAVSKTVKITVN